MTQNIFWQYLAWQFLETPKEILKAWLNFLRFNLNYFSVGLLLKTFFSPWRKYQMPYGKGIDIGKHFEALISNLIFRAVGAAIRSFLIVAGLLFEIFIIFAGFLVFLGWLFLPLLLALGLILGFNILI